MAVFLSPVGGVAAQFFTNTGAVLTGGKLFTYLAGTTTPAATYTSSNGFTAWTNPIVLDAAGRVPSGGEIWLTDGLLYKFVLKDANDVLIATYDNISGINSNFVAFVNQQEIVTATAGQTVFNLGISYQPGTNSLSVFVDGVNQYGPGAQYSYVETDANTVTFNAGLHVGAEVKFTTTQQQGAGAVDASQVSYTPPFTGSVPTNVEAKLAQYVSVKDFGAVGDGIIDDTAAIQAALNSGVKLIYAPTGTYKITTLVLPNNVSLVGDGPAATIFDGSGASYGDLTDGCHIITYAGTLSATAILTALPALSGNVAEGDRTLPFASAPSVSGNDIIVIYNPTDYSFSGFRSYYRAGEMARVATVSGSTVAMQGTLCDSYLAADVDLYKMTETTTCSLSGFSLKGLADTSNQVTGIFFRHAVDSSISNVKVTNCSYAQINVRDSFNVQLSNVTAMEDFVNSFTGDYALAFLNTQNASVVGGYFASIRHGITISGGDDVGSVPSRFINVGQAYISTSGDVPAADIHGIAEYITYDSNIIDGGMSPGGDHFVITNNQIRGGYPIDESAIYVTELRGCTFSIQGNVITNNGLPTAGRGAFIDLGGNGAAISAETEKGGSIVIQNNSFIWTTAAASAATAYIKIVNRGYTGSDPISVFIKNNDLAMPNTTNGQGMCEVQVISATGVAFDTVDFSENSCQGVGGLLLRNTTSANAAATNVYAHNNKLSNGYLYGIDISQATGYISVKGNTISGMRYYAYNMGGISNTSRCGKIHLTGNTAFDCLESSTGSTATNADWIVSNADYAVSHDNVSGTLSANISYMGAYTNITNLWQGNNVSMNGDSNYTSNVTVNTSI